MHVRSRIIVVFLTLLSVSVITLPLYAQFNVPQESTQEQLNDQPYAPNEILVTFTVENDPELLEALAAKRAAQRTSFFGRFFLALDNVSLKLQDKQAPEKSVLLLQAVDQRFHVVSRTPISQQDVKEGLVTYVVKTDETLDPLVMAGAYEKLDIVESAQPNYYYTLWE